MGGGGYAMDAVRRSWSREYLVCSAPIPAELHDPDPRCLRQRAAHHRHDDGPRHQGGADRGIWTLRLVDFALAPRAAVALVLDAERAPRCRLMAIASLVGMSAARVAEPST